MEVSVPVLDTGAGGYAFGIEVALLERVYPMRHIVDLLEEADTAAETIAEFFFDQPSYEVKTWESVKVGTTPLGTAAANIRNAVLESVDEFSDAYAVANPR